MVSAQTITLKYQTSCPEKLARELNIRVFYEDLPGNVKGFYVPVKEQPVIVLSKNISKARQRFILAYLLFVHLNGGADLICDYDDPSKANIFALVFAVDLLTIHGEFGNKSIVEYYSEHGAPETMVSGLYNAVLHASSLCS